MRFLRVEIQQLAGFNVFRFAARLEGDFAFKALHDDLTWRLVVGNLFTRLHDNANDFEGIRLEKRCGFRRRQCSS
jgi:hypothetical protein